MKVMDQMTDAEKQMMVAENSAKHAEDVKLYTMELRSTISKLSASVKSTSIQTRIDPFLNHVSPNRASETDTMLPTAPRGYRGQLERYAHYGKVNTLVFYVAAAVLVYYDFVNFADQKSEQRLQRILNRLQLITDLGLHDFQLRGDEAVGFYLFNKTANKQLLDEPV